ncbi:hypothetical protein KUCAC02_013394 [Chaenocephalus aceratus]|nr:hypothetical protein KUCAC02_013394 [Chaenocephalus aceratus]
MKKNHVYLTPGGKGVFQYDVDVDLHLTDIGAVDALRSILDAGGFSLALSPTVNVTHINITTVCYTNGTHFQCRCEEQYVWSLSNCDTYGACDDIIDNTCGCINSIPTTGQYCVPQTVPLVFYEYKIIIEVNTSDEEQLRNVLNSLTFPVQISSSVNILDANITTVCSQDNTGFQCHCENDYLWPCDKCDIYGGKCVNTCGCINAIPPDGPYCQPADQNRAGLSQKDNLETLPYVREISTNNSITTNSSFNNSITTNSSFNNSITNNSITNNSITNNSITTNSSFNNSITTNSSFNNSNTNK